jgi:hypothetical protein
VRLPLVDTDTKDSICFRRSMAVDYARRAHKYIASGPLNVCGDTE